MYNYIITSHRYLYYSYNIIMLGNYIPYNTLIKVYVLNLNIYNQCDHI